MKQRITALFLALLLLAALSLSGCSQRLQESADGRLRVVCSLFPYYDFVRQIGGEDVDVSLLVPAGRETHSFEPTPLDVIRVSEADVFVYNGGESEVWVENILGAAGEKIPHVLRMMDYADALEEEFTEGMQQSGHDHDEDDSDEISYDEHIWTSPVQSQTLCRAIADTLCAADPAHAADYQARLTQYLAQLRRQTGRSLHQFSVRHFSSLLFLLNSMEKRTNIEPDSPMNLHHSVTKLPQLFSKTR